MWNHSTWAPPRDRANAIKGPMMKAMEPAMLNLVSFLVRCNGVEMAVR